MDQELKQRLIGAVVVTALAAIFIPMLFDDPVDNSGQVVSELIIPEAPIVEENADRLPANAEQVLNPAKDESSSAENAAYPDRPLNETEIAQAELSQEELNYPGPADAEGAQEFEIVEEAAQVVEEPIETSSQVMPEKTHHEKPVDAKAPVAAKKPVRESKTVAAKSMHGETVHEKPIETKKPAEPQKAAPAKSGVGLTRWYIRAGSFSREENATTLWTELRKQGFPVSLETAQVNGKTLYRLKVGPELDQKRAIAMQEKLNKQNKIKSILVSE
jgi:DedD protein